MINLDRLRRQVMGNLEAVAACREIAIMRADMLKVARIAKTAKFEAILTLESVQDVLMTVGEDI